ncbi:hypothetical protein M8C21_003483, partial [Ambrosia artemisiifolia]
MMMKTPLELCFIRNKNGIVLVSDKRLTASGFIESVEKPKYEEKDMDMGRPRMNKEMVAPYVRLFIDE